LSNAQANQIIFKAGTYDYLTANQLLDYSNKLNTTNSNKPSVIYKDRIIKTKSTTNQTSDKTKKSDSSEYYFKEILKDGKKSGKDAIVQFLQVTLFKTETAALLSNADGTDRKVGGEIDYETYDIVDIVMPFEELVVNMLNDGDVEKNTNVYNAPLRNIEIEISLMGISGIKTFEFFRVTNLPPPFNDDVVVFQVTNVTHVVNENTWETRLKAQLRPAYNLKGK